MNEKNDTKPNEILRIIRATYNSVEGLSATFKTEAAFRTEVFLTLALVSVALLLNTSPTEKALMIGSLFLLLMIEVVNTAIEAIVDRVSLEIHPLSKKAKDAGSAAVLIALANMIVIWGIILIG